MKSSFTVLFLVLGSIMLITAILIHSIEIFALNADFFESEYEMLGTADSIGISEAGLRTVTENLLDYTAGKRENLDMQAKINGQMREVFGQREKDHMVDVKELYLGARDVRNVCLVGMALLFLIAFKLRGKGALSKLCTSFLKVSGAFVVIVGALAIYAAIDFSGFWVSFHHLFFTNDLWQLDPRTDVLIMMVPQQFFSDLVASIIIRFVSIFAALNIVSAVGLHVINRRNKRKEAASL